MSITLELDWKLGLTGRWIYHYDDFLGTMVRGFMFRVGPVFFSLVWSTR